MSIIDRDRKLVCDMNQFEAHRLGLPDLSVQDWPEWAGRDFRLACEAMAEVRADAVRQGQNIAEENTPQATAARRAVRESAKHNRRVLGLDN
jgi:hypothetical protein